VLREAARASVKVFVVEESPVLSVRLLERLRATPELAIVGVVRRVRDAVREIAALAPDVVITDTELADGNGLALLHVLKAQRSLGRGGPRVLVWTGCQDPRRRALAEGLGAEAHFDKAREVERLVEYCRDAVSRCG
jgi:DNA-binding NarL/FixJ family response regulator